jgi:hypothetical protein
VIVVGTTLAKYVMDQEDTWASWMRNADAVRSAAGDEEVRYFAAVQQDADGVAPFAPLTSRLEALGGEWWSYSLDDGRTEVTTRNRLRHITVGQNLVTDYSVTVGADWLLFMAADCQPPDDVVPRMLEMGHPLVAPYISTYCLTGPAVPGYAFPVMDAMASAACIFIARDVFRRLRWRWDPEHGSDDPCYRLDADELLGIRTHVRTDVTARHFPEAVGAIETRGHDMRVSR